MRPWKTVLFLTILIGTSALHGQTEKPAPPPAMPLMHAGPQQLKLAFLAGEYATATRIIPGRPGAKEIRGEGTSSVRWGLDSMFLFIDEQSVNPVMGTYRGFGVLGYEAGGGQYVLSMYNNFGDQPRYSGTFSGDTLVLKTRVPMKGGAFDQKILWYREDTTVRLRVLNDMGSGFMTVIDQTYRSVR